MDDVNLLRNSYVGEGKIGQCGGTKSNKMQGAQYELTLIF